MKPVAFYGLIIFAVVGCTSIEPVPPGTLTPQEVAVRKMNLQGLGIGDSTTALKRFAQVQKVPYGRTDYDVYDIYNPNAQISLAKAYFAGGKLKRLELLYFDGPNVRTLSGAGGWEGVKAYLVSKFGPPSRMGKDVAVATDDPGVKAATAKFNGEWIFSRQNRQLNFIADSGSAGGIGVVTLQDATPVLAALPKAKSGIVTVVRAPQPSPQPAPAKVAEPVPAPARATLNQVPMRPVDPGF